MNGRVLQFEKRHRTYQEQVLLLARRRRRVSARERWLTTPEDVRPLHYLVTKSELLAVCRRLAREAQPEETPLKTILATLLAFRKAAQEYEGRDRAALERAKALGKMKEYFFRQQNSTVDVRRWEELRRSGGATDFLPDPPLFEDDW